MKNQEIEGFERTGHRVDSGLAYYMTEEIAACNYRYWAEDKRKNPRAGIMLKVPVFCSKKEAESILKRLQEAGYWRNYGIPF